MNKDQKGYVDLFPIISFLLFFIVGIIIITLARHIAIIDAFFIKYDYMQLVINVLLVIGFYLVWYFAKRIYSKKAVK